MQLLPLSLDARQYLYARGLNDATIDKFIGFVEKDGHGWITIAVNAPTGTFYKLRAAPGNPSPNKMMVEPSGSPSTLFGQGVLKVPGINRIFVCEGELDCILLLQHNIPAVTSTAGALGFQEEWLAMFPERCEVVLTFDNDEAGAKGREKLRGMLREKRPDIAIADIFFEEFGTKGYDVTDFFLQMQKEGKDAREEFLKRIVTYAEEEKKVRTIAQVPIPGRLLTVTEWQATIGAHFPDLAFPAKVCASVLSQLLIHDVHNPFALVLTDAPSTGKTICVNFFDGLKGISYATDNFTPAAFVSNIAGRSSKQLEEIDLLPRIRHKLLLVRELATMLSENDDALRNRLGQLTRVLDGEGLLVESGVYGQRGYQGEFNFMMIGASTPFPLRVWKLMSGMGHRLFFLGIHSRTKSEEDLVMQSSGTPFKKKEKACKQATHDLMYRVWRENQHGVEWAYDADDPDVLRFIARFALLLRRLRAEILVWKDHGADGQEITSTKPSIEDPSRINTCLTNLARGHAVLNGRKSLTTEDLQVVAAVALDTAPDPRPQLLKHLLRGGGTITVERIMQEMNISRYTAEKEAHKFLKLGLCDGNVEDTSSWEPSYTMVPQTGKNTIVLKEEFRWLLGEEMEGLLTQIGILERL